jgi:hypothetical protein
MCDKNKMTNLFNNANLKKKEKILSYASQKKKK